MNGSHFLGLESTVPFAIGNPASRLTKRSDPASPSRFPMSVSPKIGAASVGVFRMLGETLNPIPMATHALDALTDRLNEVIRLHKQNTIELKSIRKELLTLHQEEESISPPPLPESSEQVQEEATQAISEPAMSAKEPAQELPSSPPTRNARQWEEFIGGNLIAKIGIGILVIGLGFFIKYAVDNSLLSPTLRIAGGFLAGFTLIGLAYRLKSKFLNYSALLFGGGLSVLYFTTFAGYSFYELFPLPMAFGLMLIFTLFGVFGAYKYDIQAVAILGLVGAYAVPPLLSDGGGEIAVMFSYMLILNLGVLAVAVHKDWRLLNYVAFALTWLIFLGWYGDSYDANQHYWTALGFSMAFFIIFYGVLVSYKFLRNTPFSIWEVGLLLVNAFAFFGIGYVTIENGWAGADGAMISGERFLGLFSLGNAVLHFGVAAAFYRRKLADNNIFFLIAGLVLTFLTITIPIQLEGNWVTLLWAVEAVLLFWVGQREGARFYQWLALPLIVLAAGSWGEDMNAGYAFSQYSAEFYELLPVLNLQFFTTVFVALAVGMMLFIRKESVKTHGETVETKGIRFFQTILICLLIIVTFLGGWMEISHSFYQAMAHGAIEIEGVKYFRPSLEHFRVLWIVIFAMLYWGAVNWWHGHKWQSEEGGVIVYMISAVIALTYLMGAPVELGELREAYLYPDPESLFQPSIWHLLIRYVSYAALGGLLFGVWSSAKQTIHTPRFRMLIEVSLYVVGAVILLLEAKHIYLLTVIESQVPAATDLMYRVGYSILLGMYALAVVGVGFWREKAYLRIGGMALLGTVLLKVLLHDMREASLGNKTVVFVALGILLLITAFLYQRFQKEEKSEAGKEE